MNIDFAARWLCIFMALLLVVIMTTAVVDFLIASWRDWRSS